MRGKLSALILFWIIFISPINWAQEKIILVGGDSDNPPYSYVDARGEFKGINVDWFEALAKEMDLEIQWVPMEEALAEHALERKEIDLLCGVQITEYGKLTFSFSQPLSTYGQGIFVKDRYENYGIHNLKDLKNKHVGYVVGQTSREFLGLISGVSLYPVLSIKEGLLILEEDKIDAFVGNQCKGFQMITEQGGFNDVILVAENIDEKPYAIAAHKDSKPLLLQINKGLERIKSSGKFEKIKKEWYTSPESEKDHFQPESLFLFGALCGGIIGAFCFYIYQRKIGFGEKMQKDGRGYLESLALYDSHVLENLRMGFALFDEDRSVVFANAMARKLARANIPKGARLKEVALFSAIQDSVWEKAFLGEVVLKESVDIKQGDSRQNLSCDLVPFSSFHGIKLVCLFVYDLTNEKTFFETIKQNNKITALNHLSVGMIHELKTPIHSIAAYIRLLEKRWDDPGFKTDFLKMISKEIQRSNSFILQILGYAKSGGGQKSFLNLGELFEDVARLFRAKMIEKRIDFYSNGGGMEVWANGNHIKQAFINLIMNSFEAVEKNGRIAIVATPEKEAVIIKFKDSGKGIPPQTQKFIFEPFETFKDGGTGIGLALSKQLIEANNGEIFLIKSDEQGTEMGVRLPKTPS